MRRSFIALCVLALAAGCTAQPAAAIRIAGDETTKIGTAFSNIPHNSALSFGAITICLTQPAVATITAVSLHQPNGGLRVDDFALRPVSPEGDLLGNVLEPLREVPFTESPPTLRGSCGGASPSIDVAADGTGEVFELAIQISWTTGETATASGIDIAYTVDGAQGSSTLPWAVGLCEAECPDGLLR